MSVSCIIINSIEVAEKFLEKGVLNRDYMLELLGPRPFEEKHTVAIS